MTSTSVPAIGSSASRSPIARVGLEYGAIVAGVLVALAWGVALALQERAWAEVLHQDAMASWLASGQEDVPPVLSGAAVWLPSVVRQALVVGIVGLVLAALVRRGWSVLAVVCVLLLFLPSAGLGWTAVRDPLMPGPYVDTLNWWPWSGTALLLLAVAVPGLVAAVTARRRDAVPGVFRGRAVAMVALLAVTVYILPMAAPLATGTASGAQVLVEMAAVVAVVVATSVLVSTSSRVGWTAVGLVSVGSLLALLDSWYEARWDTVQLGAVVMLGPVLLLSAAPAGRAWRALFRRGPGLTTASV